MKGNVRCVNREGSPSFSSCLPSLWRSCGPISASALRAFYLAVSHFDFHQLSMLNPHEYSSLCLVLQVKIMDPRLSTMQRAVYSSTATIRYHSLPPVIRVPCTWAIRLKIIQISERLSVRVLYFSCLKPSDLLKLHYTSIKPGRSCEGVIAWSCPASRPPALAAASEASTSTAENNKAQHSTVQHSIAQHSSHYR